MSDFDQVLARIGRQIEEIKKEYAPVANAQGTTVLMSKSAKASAVPGAA
jgi:hypothetical protein